MLVVQVVPVGQLDVFKLLRAKLRGASTWSWANKAKTRLKHAQRPKGGHIEVGSADGVLVARIRPKTPNDLFYLAEKFTGRMVAWFAGELIAINMQFVSEPPAPRRRRRR
ncbi:MAG TPA: hypothetical protein VFU46_00720 [Gemmatimonadales bacterium]|nr:hypothetical protein [Gemmatimonadales bacterium]